MTTYTKDTEYGRKYATYLYLIYRVEAGELKRYGLFETREGAERELAMINRKIPRWKIADLPCVGWGITPNDMVSRNTARVSDGVRH